MKSALLTTRRLVAGNKAAEVSQVMSEDSVHSLFDEAMSTGPISDYPLLSSPRSTDEDGGSILHHQSS